MSLSNYSTICNDGGFGPAVPQLSQCRGGFDFTVTFEEATFSILPACLLLLFSPWRLADLRGRTLKTARSWRYGLKLSILAVLGIIKVSLIAVVSTRHSVDFWAVLVASTALQLCSVVVLGVLSHLEHRNTVRPSATISIYLALTCILDAARIRTQALVPGQSKVAGLLGAAAAVKLVALAVEMQEKISILLPEYAAGFSSESHANLVSRAFFLWLNPLLHLGFRNVMSAQDLPNIHQKLASDNLAARVQSGWDKCDQKRKHALALQVLLAFPKELLLIFVARSLEVALVIAYPFLVQQAISFLETPQASVNIGYGLVGAFFFVSMGIALVAPWCFHIVFRFMTITRGALVAMVYSKLLRTRSNALEQSTALTLMTTDSEKIVEAFWRLVLDSWSCIMQLGILIYLLYKQVGAVCCVPILAMLFCFAVVSFTGSKVPRYQNTWFEAVEARVNLTSHTLTHFNSVKLLGLAEKMETRIQDKRREEMKLSQNFRLNNCLALTFSLLPLVLSPLLTFATFAALGTTAQGSIFSVSKAVTSLSILNLMNTPARRLLFSIPYGLQALGSFRRIQKFLLLDEHLESAKTDPLNPEEAEEIASEQKLDPVPTNAAISTKGAEFGWDVDGPSIVCLGDMNLAKGSFTAITGPIGCGKSTLLQGLLSETTCTKGSVQVSAAKIAYCPQTPWIYDGTIRDNIVGESEFDSVWYKIVLSSCELDSDLDYMPAGDATMVGSMGSGVSGGQKQRISIARALYAKKDLVLFDDVTNALDARTLHAVTEKVFGRNGLLRSRGSTVILTTHSVQLLKAADQVLLMGSKGDMLDTGTYEEVYKQLMDMTDAPAEISSEIDVGADSKANLGEYQVQLEERMTDLQRQTGDWRSYILYIQSLGWLNSFVFIFGAVTYALSVAFFQIWVTWWSSDETGRHTLGYWLGIYVVWGVLIMLALLITPMGYIYYMVPKSSVTLHQNLLAAAMRAPISFISKIDTGVLVNRFSQDIRLCDWQLPIALIVALFEFLGVVASIGIAVSAIAWIAIGIPVMGAVLFFLQRFYLRTSRQLRLLEIEAKAPLVSSFIETIQGITSIRAFGWSQNFMQKTAFLLDKSQKPMYLLFCVQRWLLLVLSLMAVALVVLLMGVAIPLRDTVSSGFVGLALVQVTTLTDMMNTLVVQWTEMESCLGAVTRISHFTKDTPREGLPAEAAHSVEEWPAEGAVVMENVSASYEPQGDLALKEISFSIRPGEHVAVCGRTGSGKSSLVAALLRRLECQGGRIMISGVDLSTLGPELVRSRLNLITQEPFLFQGTVRENAAPWEDQVSDESIIEVLGRLKLWDKIESLGGLDGPLEEHSLSHGQRQLFCLARALLRESKIVILDEPTSQIDSDTDATIQRVIREDLQSRTVIMISHRLQSVMDFDRVFMLDSGRLIEEGPPRNLLSDKESAFKALCDASRIKVQT